MENFLSSRRFRIWQYYVSHSQLVLRSPRNENDVNSENIDLIFKGVFYLELPIHSVGIEIRLPTEQELKYLETRSGTRKELTSQFYVLITSDQRYYIGAAFFSIESNKLLLVTNIDTF